MEGKTLTLKTHAKYQNPAGFKQVAAEFERSNYAMSVDLPERMCRSIFDTEGTFAEGEPEVIRRAEGELAKQVATAVRASGRADPTKLTAKIENGLLTVRIKKRTETQVKKIEIL